MLTDSDFILRQQQYRNAIDGHFELITAYQAMIHELIRLIEKRADDNSLSIEQKLYLPTRQVFNIIAKGVNNDTNTES